MSDNDKMLNDAIQHHRYLLEYYDAMGYKDGVQVQERYIAWLAELQRYRAEPVKHGEWEQVDDNKCRCTSCGTVAFIALYPNGANNNYCPNCGAIMHGGADNEL